MDRQGGTDHGLGQAESAGQAAQERLETDIFHLDFSVRKSRRYHEKLCAFYGGWRDWGKIITVVASSGAAVLVFSGTKYLAELFVSIAGLWAVIDLLATPDKMAQQHCGLRDRFTELATKIELMPHTREDYRKLAAERLQIERDEPPCKRLVDIQARNEEMRSRDYPPEDLAPVNGVQRKVGYFFPIGMGRLERWQSERQRQVRAAAS
jgi:hypothetical protein